MKQWYVMQSKPQKESLLYEQLCLREIETYYPCYRANPVNPRARKIRSYFPSYLFVHADLARIGISSMQWVPGAIGLVKFGGEPAYIVESVLNAIRLRVDEIVKDGSNSNIKYKHGDVVSICEGPFSGYKAIFDASLPGSERVRVLLKILQDHQIPLELPTRQVQPLHIASNLDKKNDSQKISLLSYVSTQH
jgi:transcriptional antiterminator RfaH